MYRSFEANSEKDSNSEGSISLDWIEQSIQQIADEIEYAPEHTPIKSMKEHTPENSPKNTEKLADKEPAIKQVRELPRTPRDTLPYTHCNFRTRSGQFKQYEISIVNDEVVFLRPQSTNTTRIAYKLDSFQCLKTLAPRTDSDDSAIACSVQLIISSEQQRFVYFESEQAQQFWHKKILSAQGFLDKRINQYTPEKKLGEGSFGTVVLASHKNSGLQVAIKIISKLKI